MKIPKSDMMILILVTTVLILVFLATVVIAIIMSVAAHRGYDHGFPHWIHPATYVACMCMTMLGPPLVALWWFALVPDH